MGCRDLLVLGLRPDAIPAAHVVSHGYYCKFHPPGAL
jgi:hypothetical protein